MAGEATDAGASASGRGEIIRRTIRTNDIPRSRVEDWIAVRVFDDLDETFGRASGELE